jgi:hypothetical protein
MNRVGWPRHWRWFLNAGERVRLFRAAEDRARPEQDRRLGAAVFLRRRAAGHDAGGRSSNGHGLPPAGTGGPLSKKRRPPSIIATALAVPKIAANNERPTRRRPIDGPGC